MTEREKPVLAIDIDEVLGQFVAKFVPYYNEKYGAQLTVDDFRGAYMHVFNTSYEETNRRVDGFFEHGPITELEPVEGAYEALVELKKYFSLQIITARQTRFEECTRIWIERHFPNVFDAIHFGNHFSSNGKERTKAEICREIGAVMLIDDNFKYADQCAAEGFPVILFGHYPWNTGSDHVPHPELHLVHDDAKWLMRRVPGWKDAVSHVFSRLSVDRYSSYQVFESDEYSSSGHTHTRTEILDTMSEDGRSKSTIVYTYQEIDDAKMSDEVNSHSTTSISENLSPEQKTNKFRVAVIQLNSSNDKQSNLEKIEKWVSTAKSNGVEFVCLPECCVYMKSSQGSESQTNILLQAEQLAYGDKNVAFSKLCDIARTYGIFVSVGGFPERVLEDETRVYNSHFILNSKGEIHGKVYRKIHLFDNPLTGLCESQTTKSGDSLVAVDLNDGIRLGLSICYDLRFPELYRRLADAPKECNILLVPAAFTYKTGCMHWELLLRARAVENQCFVVAAAQCGNHNGSQERVSFGHSCIVDPLGNILVNCGNETEGLVWTDINLDSIKELRSSFPVWNHKRNDILGSASIPLI